MFNKMIGGAPMPFQVRVVILFIILIIWVVIFLFSWVPMSDKYPGYAHATDERIRAAFWTGASIAPAYIVTRMLASTAFSS